MTERRAPGATDIQLSPIGLGCWQLPEGRGVIGGFWEALNREDVRDIVRVSVEAAISRSDAAEA